MTDVGKIKLGVEIDAGDLSAKLGEAVRRAIAPALSQIQRELNKVQREYDETARAAEKSAAKQAAANKITERSLRDVERQALKTAAAIRAIPNHPGGGRGPHGGPHGGGNNGGFGGNTRITYNNKYDYSRHTITNHKTTNTTKYDYSTRTINHYHYGGGGGGGNNRPLGPGGGSGGGGNDRSGGMLSRFTQPGYLALGGLGAQAVPGILTGATNLLGAVQQLGQVGLALPAIYGSVAASVGTAVVGFKGMGDAVKELNEAAESGDYTKVEKLFKKMAPEAQQTAKAMSELSRGPLTDLKKNVQSHMFKGMGDELRLLGKQTIPTVSNGMGKIGDAWNQTMKAIRPALTREREGAGTSLSLIDRFMGNTAEGQKRAKEAIDPIVHAMATLMSTGGEFLPRLGDAFAKVANRFDDFISKAGKSGQLWKWIDEGLNGMRALGNAVINIGKTLAHLTTAAGGDGGFLGWLERATKKMSDFTGSAEGQRKITDFFKFGHEGLAKWGDLLSTLGPILLHILEGFAQWGQIMFPVVKSVADIVGTLDRVPGLITAIVTALIALRTASGALSLLGLGLSVGGVGIGARGAAGAAAGAGAAGAGGFLRGKTGRGLLGGAGLLASNVLLNESVQSNNTAGQVGGFLGSVASGALLGGTIGSVVPGVGTAVGAGVGAGLGAALAAVNIGLAENERAAKAAADANAKLAASMKASTDAMDVSQDAARQLRDNMLNNGGQGAAFDPNVMGNVGTMIEAIPETLRGKFGDDFGKQATEVMKNLHMSLDDVTRSVTGTDDQFNALRARLFEAGPAGATMAASMQQVRDAVIQAQNAGQTAGPIFANLAQAMNLPNASAAAAAMKNVADALAAMSHGGPITVDMAGVQTLMDMMKNLGQQFHTEGNMLILDGMISPQLQQAMQAIDVNLTKFANGTVGLQINQGQYTDSVAKVQTLTDMYQRMLQQAQSPLPVPPPVFQGLPPGAPVPGATAVPPRAGGGIVRRRGYAGGGIPGGIGAFGPGWDNATQELYKGHIIPRDNPSARLYIDSMGGMADMQWWPGMFGNNDETDPFRRGYPTGGVLPGYSPGVDNMMVPLSGGEGIIIPEAMRAIGSDALYRLNSQFRGGLSRNGYAGGGVFGFAGGGVHDVGGFGNDATELGVLIQIRDLLAGKGGAGNPLSAMANNTGLMQQQMMGGGGGIGGTSGTTMGPFGTPIGPRNRGYEMAAAAIQALGGQPELILGPNPAQYGGGMPGVGGAGGVGGVGRAPADMGKYSAALAAFAGSGNLSDVTGLGLDANDAVVKAIAAARNKKKGGLTDAQIEDLVQQVIGGGGYSGALTDQNTSLVSALQSFREKLLKGTVGGGMPAAGVAGMPGVGGAGGAKTSAASLIAFAQAANGGKYAAASDLSHGLADCSGAVSDLVELLTQGQATPARLFSTANEEQVLKGLGAVEGLIPGSLQIGMSPSHTAATLPNGVNFESGGSGGGVVYGGKVGAGDSQFTKHFSLPTDMTGQVVGAGYGGGGIPGMGGAGMGGGGGVQNVFVTNMPGSGMGGMSDAAAQQVAQMAMPAAGAAVGAGLNAGGQAMTDAVRGVGLPGLSRTPTAANTALSTLLHERNPNALFRAAGINVEDYSRAGGVDPNQVQGPPRAYDAQGRLFSDTTDLISRTFTDMNAQMEATRSQTVGVMTEVKNKLTDKALEPVLTTGVSSGFSAISTGTFNTMGTAIGQSAAPPIAQAVGQAVSALPVQSANSNPSGFDFSAIGAGIGGIGLAAGGPVYGGTPGKDSVPALLMPNEFVFNTTDVARMGGVQGVERFRSALAAGAVRRFAGGGTVGGNKRIGNDTVGADFFGVSEIPIIGMIVNLIIRVLLKVIGVEIEVRDTLNNMGKDFRQFRGDAFKSFDAQGRLLNDTSALIDRNQTSSETAAEERIRILKIVIEALIKYIIEKVIVPVTKAVANSVIQAGASAATMAINTQAPGAGNVAGSLISSLGQAGVEIAGEVGTDLALSMTSVLTDVVTEGMQSLLPDLVNSVFGGGLLAMIFNPIGNLLTTILGGFMGAFTALFGGVFGGMATLIPGLPFDQGGMAYGVGYLPKATAEPELVLSPAETDIFTRFVHALEGAGLGAGGNRTVHAPITVLGGGVETARQVEDRLLTLMP